MTELREKVAREIRNALGQDHGHIPSQIASETLADRILAIPELAALKLTPVRKLNLGASVSTDKRDPV